MMKVKIFSENARTFSMVAVGVYFVRRIKNSGDYYVAGRSLGPLVMMATVCATIIGGSRPTDTKRISM